MLQKITVHSEYEAKTFIEQLLLNDYWVHVNTTKTLSQELGIDDGCSFEIEFEKEGEE